MITVVAIGCFLVIVIVIGWEQGYFDWLFEDNDDEDEWK